MTNDLLTLTDDKVKTLFREAQKGDERCLFFIKRLYQSDHKVNGETLKDQFRRVYQELVSEEESN